MQPNKHDAKYKMHHRWNHWLTHTMEATTLFYIITKGMFDMIIQLLVLSLTLSVLSFSSHSLLGDPNAEEHSGVSNYSIPHIF